MSDQTKQKLFKLALAGFGVIFLFVYPLGFVWPSGWVWHNGEGVYYLQMISGLYLVLGIYLIIAARNPSDHGSLISFTIWSSVVHGSIMLVQAAMDGMEHGHLLGDVPALFLVALVLWILSPRRSAV